MKMGIKEFRSKISELADGSEPVVITNHGREIATLIPNGWRRDLKAARRAARDIKRWQEEMRARGIDLDAILADMGMDPWGAPIDADADR